MSYRVFKRRAWRRDVDKRWVPAHNQRKYTQATGLTLDEARKLCAEHNPPPSERSPGHPAIYWEFETEEPS